MFERIKHALFSVESMLIIATLICCAAGSSVAYYNDLALIELGREPHNLGIVAHLLGYFFVASIFGYVYTLITLFEAAMEPVKPWHSRGNG